MAASPDCRIAVVVITHNRCREWMRTLQRLTALRERPHSIVVDNASSDDTCAEVAKRYPEVALLRQGRNLGSAARNLGARALNVPHIAFCDDDAWWEPGSLSRAADLLGRHPRIGLLKARVLAGPEGSLDPTCLAMSASPLAAEEGLPGPPFPLVLSGERGGRPAIGLFRVRQVRCSFIPGRRSGSPPPPAKKRRVPRRTPWPRRRHADDRDLSALIEQFSRLRVLVIGEAMLDSYSRGAARRSCPEAPAPVVDTRSRQDFAGGAANAAMNVAALGARTSLLSKAVDDAEAMLLKTILDAA